MAQLSLGLIRMQFCQTTTLFNYERRFLFTRSLGIQNKASRKKPKNLTWSSDENTSVY